MQSKERINAIRETIRDSLTVAISCESFSYKDAMIKIKDNCSHIDTTFTEQYYNASLFSIYLLLHKLLSRCDKSKKTITALIRLLENEIYHNSPGDTTNHNI